MNQQKPIIHAKDHLPGGADPIPGLAPAPPGSPGAPVPPITTEIPKHGTPPPGGPDMPWFWWRCRETRPEHPASLPSPIVSHEENTGLAANQMVITWDGQLGNSPNLGDDPTEEIFVGTGGPNADSMAMLHLRDPVANPNGNWRGSCALGDPGWPAGHSLNWGKGATFTLLAWFNFTLTHNWDVFNINPPGGTNATYLLLNTDGSVSLHRWGNTYTSAAGLVTAGEWTYIGLSVDLGRVKVYVNPGPPEPADYSPAYGADFPLEVPMAMETWGLALGDYSADQLAARLTGAGMKSVAVRLNPPPEEMPPGMTHADYITGLTADVATLQAAGLQVVGWGPADSTSGADLTATGVTGWMPQVETPGEYTALTSALGAGVGAALPKAVVWTEAGINSSSQVTALNAAGITGYAAETYAAAGGPFTNAEGPIWQGTQFGMTPGQSIPILGTFRGETPDDYSGFDEDIIPNYGIYNVPQTSETAWAEFAQLNQGVLMLSAPVIDVADPATTTQGGPMSIAAPTLPTPPHATQGGFDGYVTELVLYFTHIAASDHRALSMSGSHGDTGTIPPQDQIPTGGIQPSQIAPGTDGQHLVTDNGTVHWATDTGGGTTSTGIWRWTTGTTDAATSGRVGLNTASWATATQVHLNKTTQAGVDATNLLALLQSGDGLYLQEQASAGNWGRYSITGAGTDNTSWWSFPVELVSSGGVPPANNADATVSLLLQGSSGGGVTDLDYHGDFPADTPYVDGDIVVYGGVPYICVTPTSSPPTPWPKLTTTYAAILASYSTYAALLAGNSSYADVIGAGAAATPNPATTSWVPMSGVQGPTGPAGPSGAAANIQTFTSSGTWTKPAGAQVVRVICVGAGGGGGAGSSNGGAAARSGGGGGGGGAYWEETFRAADLTGSVAVTVGVGGTGGTPTATTGNPGAGGTASSFGAYAMAGGGGLGAGGAAANVAGGAGGSYLANASSTTPGAPESTGFGSGNLSARPVSGGAGNSTELGGAAGGGSATASNAGAGGSSTRGGSGGGGGAGCNATPTLTGAAAGGLAGGNISGASVTSGGGGTPGSNGASPTAGGAGGTVTGRLCGSGGGGGGGTTAAGVSAGAGGAGGRGAGGGGGGVSTAGSGGAGGPGGDGLVIVMSW